MTKEEQKEYNKKYYEENKEKIKLKNKEYYEENKEKLYEKNREWALKNSDKNREIKRNWNKNNRDKIKKYEEENKDVISEYQKKWREDHKEYLSEYGDRYYQENRDRISEQSKEYRERNKESIKEKKKIYYQENKESIKEKNRLRTKTEEYKEWKKQYNEKYKYISTWRHVFKNALVRMDRDKNGKTMDLLGYSAMDLKMHLESLFLDGMSWENRNLWEVDHIIPLSIFRKDTPMNIVNCLSNLRPIWSEDNSVKYNRVEDNELSKGLIIEFGDYIIE